MEAISMISNVPLGDGRYETVVARFPGDPEYDKRILELLGPRFSNFSKNAASMCHLAPIESSKDHIENDDSNEEYNT